jgi:hypothetical protein
MRRLLVVGLALIVGGAPAVGAWHAAGERHHYCAQHGVLEESDAGVAHHDRSVETAPPVGAKKHHACAFATAEQPFDGATPHVHIARAAATPPIYQSPALREGSPPIALLSVAPKSSPPSAAV